VLPGGRNTDFYRGKRIAISFGKEHFGHFHSSKEEKMNNRTMNFISGVGVGVGMSALFGTNGGRNRALIRDKAVHYGHETSDFLSKATRDLTNRSKGLLHGKKSGRENQRLDIFQSNWAPATKLIVGSAALGVGIFAIVSLAKQPGAFRSLLGTLRDVLHDETSGPVTAEQTPASVDEPTSDMEMRSNEERFEEPVGPLETLPSGLAASQNTGAGISENQASG
jgi:hypothetical protein